LLRYDENSFYEPRLFFTDSTVFDIFSFEMVQGNPKTALTAPFSIVLTESSAQKYFGNENPLGKILRFENQLDFTVTGVVRDVPATSHIQFDFLAALLNIGDLFRASGTTFGWRGWYWNPCHTYILLPPEYSREQFEALLPGFVQKHADERLRPNLSFYLQPLTDIHLHSNLYQELGVNGNERSVYLFAIIAVFILLLACINFMNLATARSIKRAKEIAVRKVVGAFRGQLVGQFLGESLLISFIAAFLAVILVELLLPTFALISGANLNLALIGFPKLLAGVGLLAVIVGLIAGSYPALFLSSYLPVEGLGSKSNRGAGTITAFFRKGLVVFQFCISIALLVGTAVIYQQHKFLQQKELGFDKEQIVMIPIRGTSIKPQVEAFKARLRQDAAVLNTSAVSNVIGRDVQVCPFGTEGKTEVLQMPGLFVDHDFIKTFGVQLQQGRGFDVAFSTDSVAFLLNEAAVNLIEWKEPLGKRMKFGPEGQVIGVVKDFNYASLRERIRPMAILIRPGWFSYVAVRLAPGDFQSTLRRLETVWQQFEPQRPFEPFFLDDNLNQLYKKEERLSLILSSFSMLAIVIACLGLFGLAAFATEQRTKEIGIRKVLGASVTNLVTLLSKDFAKLVLIANVIAWPVAWFAMSKWLEDFPYRIAMGPKFLIFASLAALAVAILTVSYQALRAALANPVDSLRYE
jgi:putative ABC transport system permease protein